MAVSRFRNNSPARALLALAAFLALPAPSAAQEIKVHDLGDSIKAGMVSFEGARGTGASTGAAVDCVLRNLADSDIYVDVDDEDLARSFLK